MFWILKKTMSEFGDDECSTRAAALAYYAVFSLPALLVLVVTITGFFWYPGDVRGQIGKQISEVVGAGGAEQIETMLQHANKPGRGVLGMLIGIGALLFGATGVVVQLQSTLNKAWEVEPDPSQGGVRNFVSKRILSFAMILALAFLLLVSFMLSILVGAAGDALAGMISNQASNLLLFGIDLGLSILLITLLFAVMYKFLPDARVRWSNVWLGGLLAAALFIVGKYLLAWYISQSNPASTYGAAGSLVLILLWLYYSAIILLIGAEFTQVWAKTRGGGIRPERGAVRTAEREDGAGAQLH